MPGDGLGEGEFFEVAAFSNEVFYGIAMRYVGDALVDDGALVEVGRCVVGCGSDEFDASAVGLMVRFGSGEGRQETVVDIDNGFAERIQKIGGENLHVAGHDHEFDAFSLQEGELLRFCVCLGSLGDGDVVERDAVGFGDAFEVFMVRDDEGDFAGVLAGLPSKDQVVEAVVEFGYENGDLGLVAGDGDLGFHTDGIAECLECVGGFPCVRAIVDGPLHALEEDASFRVPVLVGVDDVPPVVEYPS